MCHIGNTKVEVAVQVVERSVLAALRNLDFSEWGDAFPNRLFGAATLDPLRHGAYRLTLEGESLRLPRPIPERRTWVAPSGRSATAELLVRPIEAPVAPQAHVVLRPRLIFRGSSTPPPGSWRPAPRTCGAAATLRRLRFHCVLRRPCRRRTRQRQPIPRLLTAVRATDYLVSRINPSRGRRRSKPWQSVEPGREK